MLTACDVLVVGGGVAGTAAAVAAARSGARTVLVERERFLGGTGYAGLLQHICGLYLHDDALPSGTLNAGISREIEQALLVRSPARSLRRIGRVAVLPMTRQDLLSVLRGLCSAERNLDVYEDTQAVAVGAQAGRVESVALRRIGEYRIFPKLVIDCSGDAAAAALAGARCQTAPGGHRLLSGYVVRITGLTDTDELLSVKVPYHLAKAVREGVFGDLVRYTAFTIGESAGEGYCKLSVDAEAGPDRDELARNTSASIVRYLGTVLPEFRNASLAETSLRVMDREGRRVLGEYVLAEEDVLTARKFSDGVVKNCWPVELWDREKGTVYKYVPSGDWYEIPFRCLKIADIENMLAAGRCISVSREALASTRVMGTCIALGEVAGKAAAYYVKHGKYPENLREY